MAGAQAVPRHSEGRPSRLLYASEVVRVGQFRCAVSHPQFGDSGPTRDYCFVFPRTAVWIEHDGAPPFVADSTVVPLYNPGHPYKRRAISPDGDRTDWFAVAPGVLREMLAVHGAAAADADTRLFDVSFARSRATTFALQRAVFEHVRQRTCPDQLYVEESVVGVLGEVLDGLCEDRREAVRARQRALVERTRERLAQTFAQDEGLTALAAALGTSVFHLCRVFKQVTGQTIHQYRNELRLRHSLELLHGHRTILDTALDLGYSGHSHFTRAFHRAFGLPPSAFRALGDGSRR